MDGTNYEFMKWLATLGIGGVLAGFMFMFYRKDIKQYTELWQSIAGQLAQIVKENTSSNTKLITMLESLERNSMRKSDLESLLTKLMRLIDERIKEHERKEIEE